MIRDLSFLKSHNSSDNQFTTTNQKILLQEKICPPQAFQHGDPKTAAQFLKEQQADKYKYSHFNQVNTFIQQYPDVMSSFTPDETRHVYQGLIHRMYYAVDYTPDREAFYQQLQAQLEAFIQGFHNLCQQVEKHE